MSGGREDSGGQSGYVFTVGSHQWEVKRMYIEGECLGGSCRFYYVQPDMICFKQGVLPRCSPGLKNKRKELDAAAPELLETLKAITYFLTNYRIATKDDSDWPILNRMNKAIAKAEVK